MTRALSIIACLILASALVFALCGCISVKHPDGMHTQTTIHPICGWETWGSDPSFLDKVTIFYIPVFWNNE